MELNKNMMQKTVLALVLLAVAALSAFCSIGKSICAGIP